MEKQQKILQMAKDICRVKLNCNDVCNPISACDALKYAERAVEAGYIKVVRCKDCKYYIASYCTRDIKGRTNMFYMTENDFCSYGERSEMKGGAE